MDESFVPISKLLKDPFNSIINYPTGTNRSTSARLKELKKLGVSSLSFRGDIRLGSLRVLGKGYVGIVVMAKRKNKICALKIRRADSQRKRMNDEAKLLKIVNKVGIGPKLIDKSKNFLVMEYLEGEKIGDWVNQISGKGTSKLLKNTIKKILEDCYKLDKIGLDHGELSSLSKHIIIGKSKITILDFESSSTKRQVSNVTSATQGIFIGSGISKKINRIYKIPPKTKIIESLRTYKRDKSKENFDKVLSSLKII